MKNVLGYSKFKELRLNEKYEEDPEYRIKKFFDKLTKSIKVWFTEGSLSKNTQMYDIDVSTSNNVDKTLILDFQDSNYYYQVIFIVSLEEVSEDTLNECYIKVKRYDINTSELLHEIDESVMVRDLNENKLLEIFSKLDEETKPKLDDEGNLDTSEEDINLENTDIV